MRVLITGASGFAGRYLARACAEEGEEVLGLSRSGELPAEAGSGAAVDLCDAKAIGEAVHSFRPEVVYHLAALSSVGRSWEEPAETLRVNTSSAVNLLEAVRAHAPSARVVWVSSCEVYGAPESLPVNETAALRPANPYSVSKLAADLLAGLYVDAHALHIVRVRPFNHAGPGQRPIFILSSLARQAAEARLACLEELQIVTGNPNTRRDFTDVRDVVRAYRMLVSADAGPGIYNVCSGSSVSAAEQVQLVGELVAPLRVEHSVDPDRVRSYEVPDLYGSFERLRTATGWEPEIPLRQTMADTIEWWERELASDPA